MSPLTAMTRLIRSLISPSSPVEVTGGRSNTTTSPRLTSWSWYDSLLTSTRSPMCERRLHRLRRDPEGLDEEGLDQQRDGDPAADDPQPFEDGAAPAPAGLGAGIVAAVAPVSLVVSVTPAPVGGVGALGEPVVVGVLALEGGAAVAVGAEVAGLVRELPGASSPVLLRGRSVTHGRARPALRGVGIDHPDVRPQPHQQAFEPWGGRHP